MNWRIGFSKESISFLDENGSFSKNNVITLAQLAVKMLSGESVSLDIKKLKGAWKGFYRVRKGKLRIIVSFDFEKLFIFIERIDWRGNAYK